MRLETTHLTKSGREFPVEVTANQIRYGKRTLNILFARDIGARKAAERRVHETQSRLAAVMDVLPGYVFMKDAQSRYVMVNRRFADDFAVVDSEIAGRTHEALFGAETASRLTDADSLVLQHGETVYVREAVVRIAGTPRTITMRKAPLRDQHGAVIGLVALAMDISDRKEMEEALRTTNSALRRANADLEQFAYAAAHDLREPLRTIALYTQMLERSHARDISENAARAVRYVLESAHRMETLVNDLLAFTQAVNPSVHAAADANDVAREAVEALRAAIDGCRAEIRLADLPSVAVERVHLRQVLQNLIANAVQYRDGERPARVVVRAEQSDGDAVFHVSDNGVGIKPEYHERIFGLFKRLHGLDVPGNGIGLALCQKIVESYGGRIWVESAPGCGSKFSFTLPLVRQSQ
jgi:PAS domain S-box-containing protein